MDSQISEMKRKLQSDYNPALANALFNSLNRAGLVDEAKISILALFGLPAAKKISQRVLTHSKTMFKPLGRIVTAKICAGILKDFFLEHKVDKYTEDKNELLDAILSYKEGDSLPDPPFYLDYMDNPILIMASGDYVIMGIHALRESLATKESEDFRKYDSLPNKIFNKIVQYNAANDIKVDLDGLSPGDAIDRGYYLLDGVIKENRKEIESGIYSRLQPFVNVLLMTEV